MYIQETHLGTQKTLRNTHVHTRNTKKCTENVKKCHETSILVIFLCLICWICKGGGGRERGRWKKKMAPGGSQTGLKQTWPTKTGQVEPPPPHTYLIAVLVDANWFP